jgi:broad specificity phosphatase PhoE
MRARLTHRPGLERRRERGPYRPRRPAPTMVKDAARKVAQAWEAVMKGEPDDTVEDAPGVMLRALMRRRA